MACKYWSFRKDTYSKMKKEFSNVIILNTIKWNYKLMIKTSLTNKNTRQRVNKYSKLREVSFGTKILMQAKKIKVIHKRLSQHDDYF